MKNSITQTFVSKTKVPQSQTRKGKLGIGLLLALLTAQASPQARAMDEGETTPTAEDRHRHEISSLDKFDRMDNIPQAFLDLAKYQSKSKNQYDQFRSLGISLWSPDNLQNNWRILGGSAALYFWAYQYGVADDTLKIKDIDVIMLEPLNYALRFFPQSFTLDEGFVDTSMKAAVTVRGAEGYFDTDFISGKSGICNSGPEDRGYLNGKRQPVVSPDRLLRQKRSHLLHLPTSAAIKKAKAERDIALLEKIIAMQQQALADL